MVSISPISANFLLTRKTVFLFGFGFDSVQILKRKKLSFKKQCYTYRTVEFGPVLASRNKTENAKTLSRQI